MNAGLSSCDRSSSSATVRPVTFVVCIRLSLADEAGALGRAAAVIGLHGGNIVSVDVHSTGSAAAVHDLVVEFAGEPSLDELATDMLMNAATTIVHIGPSQPVDVVTSVLSALRPDSAQPAPPAGTALTDAVAIVRPCSEWSLVDCNPDGDSITLGAGNTGGIDGTIRLEVPVPGTAQVLVGRRPATMELTATETARIDAVVRLWAGMQSVMKRPATR